MKEREVVIEGRRYRFVKLPHDTCMNCDILKDSKITHPHQYPLCYTYTTRGKETESQYGLIVNFCERNQSGVWQRIEENSEKI